MKKINYPGKLADALRGTGDSLWDRGCAQKRKRKEVAENEVTEGCEGLHREVLNTNVAPYPKSNNSNNKNI